MQKTAYEVRISDWSSDVCSSDRVEHFVQQFQRLRVQRRRVAGRGLQHTGELQQLRELRAQRGEARVQVARQRAELPQQRVVDLQAAATLAGTQAQGEVDLAADRKSTRLNSSH